VKNQNSRKQASSTAKQNATSNSVTPSSSVPNARKSKLLGTVSSCCGCGTVIGDDVKALQCDKCQSDMWKCIECFSLTPEVYDQLISLPTCGLCWYCDSCDKSSADNGSTERIDKLVTVVEKLVEKFETIESKLQDKSDLSLVMQLDTRIKNLEENMHTLEQSLESRLAAVDKNVVRYMNDQLSEIEKHQNNQPGDTATIKSVVQEEINRNTEEQQDMEKRKRNIILYRVPEKRTDNVTERKTTDFVFVKDLLDCVINLQVNEQDIEKMYRLGRWSEDRTRPLLVSFKNIDMKEDIITNLRNLKHTVDKFKNIGISQDLHPKERQEIKDMIEDAKKEHSANSTDLVENYRFIVVGKEPRKKVIKIQKTAIS